MINVIQVGIGPLGQRVVRFAIERQGIRIVGAVDPAPGKKGQDLGGLCGLKPLGLEVSPDISTILRKHKADVAILTTVSKLAALVPQVDALAKAGLHVVSSCEELAFPWRTDPANAARIDRICKRYGVACVGTGVNPGFLMDYLPCVLTSVCQKVDRVIITRIQDASNRRIPFQQKIGVGLTPGQFRAKVKDGSLRHVGLVESMHMIASNLNWKLDRTAEKLHPVIADKKITTGFIPVMKGSARGVEQIGQGYIGRAEVLRLHFRAAVGESDPVDMIEIKGVPDITSRVPGGINGDIATCAILLNAARSITSAVPGLRTMLDIAVPGCFSRM